MIPAQIQSHEGIDRSGSSSMQIYVAELVVQRIQGVQAIDERCPANDIGLQMMSLFEP
jgi:hypothetical protein